MTIKTANDIRQMEQACKLAAEALQYTGKFVKEGITTDELDKIVSDFILSRNAVSACIDYNGYPKSICTSVNEVICHGVPSSQKLKLGDIINIDITVIKHGFHGDTSSMFFVGEPSDKARRIVDCAFNAMHKGIEVAKAGSFTGDIGYSIEKYITNEGFYTVKEIGGHGIGRRFHELPFVPSYGHKGTGVQLLKWATITVEPMVNETSAPFKELIIPNSNITIVETSDKTLSAQYEHTILITDGKPVILTLV